MTLRVVVGVIRNPLHYGETAVRRSSSTGRRWRVPLCSQRTRVNDRAQELQRSLRSPVLVCLNAKTPRSGTLLNRRKWFPLIPAPTQAGEDLILEGKIPEPLRADVVRRASGVIHKYRYVLKRLVQRYGRG